MSTSSRKCTPPERSRPYDIGCAPSACSHAGVVDARFSATTNCERWRCRPAAPLERVRCRAADLRCCQAQYGVLRIEMRTFYMDAGVRRAPASRVRRCPASSAHPPLRRGSATHSRADRGSAAHRRVPMRMMNRIADVAPQRVGVGRARGPFGQPEQAIGEATHRADSDARATESLLVQRLQRTFRQRRADRTFLNSQFDVVRNLQLDEVVFYFRDPCRQCRRR